MRRLPTSALLAAPVLFSLAGCGGEAAAPPPSQGIVTAPAPGEAPPPVAPAPAPAPADQGPGLRKVIGQKTQDVKDFQAEMNAHPGDAHIASQKITAKDPITLAGNAYVTSIGKITIDQITHALNLFNALEGRYPKDYEEFMERIIRENNLALPTLPGYQEYAYDDVNHRLVVLEYPERKEQIIQRIRQGPNP